RCRVSLAGGVITGAVRPARAEEHADAGGEYDPLEPFNRKLFWFDDKLDVYVVEPVATAWAWIAPTRVRTSVANFFDNMRFPVYLLNDLLQGKLAAGASDVGRFAVNTTVGAVGLFDPASRWGL